MFKFIPFVDFIKNDYSISLTVLFLSKERGVEMLSYQNINSLNKVNGFFKYDKEYTEYQIYTFDELSLRNIINELTLLKLKKKVPASIFQKHVSRNYKDYYLIYEDYLSGICKIDVFSGEHKYNNKDSVDVTYNGKILNKKRVVKFNKMKEYLGIEL